MICNYYSRALLDSMYRCVHIDFKVYLLVLNHVPNPPRRIKDLECAAKPTLLEICNHYDLDVSNEATDEELKKILKTFLCYDTSV